MKFRTQLFWLFLITLTSVRLNAQLVNPTVIKDSVESSIPVAATNFQLILKPGILSEYSGKQLEYARVYVELISELNPMPASGQLTIPVILNGNAPLFNDNSSSQSFDLTIKKNEPRVVYYNDFTVQAANPSLSTLSLKLGTVQNTLTGVVPVKLKFRYELAYRVDVNESSVAAPLSGMVTSLVTPNGRKARFQWNTNGHYYPAYQLQVLRLYNTDPAIVEPAITANIDWSKALTVNIESDLRSSISGTGNVSYNLSLAEGSGMYIWRVRPVGNFYSNGFGNNRNYASYWSISQNNGQVIISDMGNYNQPGYFYFVDPDDDKNWIYSRIFTEGNTTKESISYADYLLRQRQSQVLIPSENSVITTHYIPDFLGRPSISTLPIPLKDQKGLDGYKENMVKDDQTGELFRDKHFDSDSRIEVPNDVRIKAQGGFEYYQDNADPAIPDANGFSYSRVIYENSTNTRITEEAGVGQDHAIGTDHTVRTLYSTASDAELIRIFGDEAPNGNKVSKITIIDQNGTATITYKDLSGKVIATCLGYNINDRANSNDPMEDANTLFTVNEVVDNNLVTNEGLLSTKRISFTQPTPLTITYSIPCASPIELCGSLQNATCKYGLYIIIHDVKEPANRIEAFKTIDPSSCGQLLTFTASDFIYKDAAHTKDAGAANPSSLTFTTGDYIIEKRLVKDNSDNNALLDEALKNIQARVQGYVGTLTGQLKLINTYQDFYKFVDKYSCVIAIPECEVDPVTNKVSCTFIEERDGCSSSSSIADGKVLVTITPSFEQDKKAVGRMMRIKSECCDFSVPIEFTPPLVCPDPVEVTECMADPSKCPAGSNSNIPYNYGFSQFAHDYLVAKAQAQGKVDDFYTSNPATWGGYSSEEIDRMIYHMLHDNYSANASDAAKVQYECDRLAECWMVSLNTITEYEKEGDGYEKGSNEPPASELDLSDMFGKMRLGALMKIFIGKKKREKMKECIDDAVGNATNNIDSKMPMPSLIETFLDCAEPKYSKVFVETTGPGNPFAGTTCLENPLALEPSEVALYQSESSHAAFYRIYAFKYYSYRVPYIMNRYFREKSCESGSCFCPNISEPEECENPCIDVNIQENQKCISVNGAAYNNTHWGFEERLKFKECLDAPGGNSVSNVLGNEGVESDIYTCDDMVETTLDELREGIIIYEDFQQELTRKTEECYTACNIKRDAVIQKVRDMFYYNCYEVVNINCNLNEKQVPESDIIKIADELIEQCKSMCSIQFIYGETKWCNFCEAGGATRAYVDVMLGSPRENKLRDFAMQAEMEIDIESRCTVADHPNYDPATGTGLESDKKAPSLVGTDACNSSSLPEYSQCEKDYHDRDPNNPGQMRAKFCDPAVFDSSGCPLDPANGETTQYIKVKIEVEE